MRAHPSKIHRGQPRGLRRRTQRRRYSTLETWFFGIFLLARRGAKKNFFAETGAARGDGQKSKHKTKKERIGIKTIKNIKKLKKNFHFPTLFGKKGGVFLCEKE